MITVQVRKGFFSVCILRSVTTVIPFLDRTIALVVVVDAGVVIVVVLVVDIAS